MSTLIRIAGLVAMLLLADGGVSSAATPKEIETAKKKGSDWLRAKFVTPPSDSNAYGATCLAGIALLESGVPGDDPAVKAITAFARKEGWKQTKTYEIALTLMYLDRYGDPSDIPLIQLLGIRLLAGQTSLGGWSYECGTPALTAVEEQALKAAKAPPVGKLHPEVEKYAQSVIAFLAKTPVPPVDDNSNTQFAVIAVWLSRKHGVPADRALDLVERRFRGTQSLQNGGWGYTSSIEGTPAMYCAGLIGIATGIARREERRVKPEPKPKVDPKAEPVLGPKSDPNDPFFNPKAPPEPKVEPKKLGPAPRAADPLDRAVQMAFAGIAMHFADNARTGAGAMFLKPTGLGRHDLYFMWSLERVAVLYGIEKIGGVNWYEVGAHVLVQAQQPAGSWVANGYLDEVNTSFAVLFLCKSNLVRDLSGKIQKEGTTEMKAGTPASTDPKTTETPTITKKDPLDPPVIIPGPMGSDVAILAAELLRAADKDWAATLTKLRDAKGNANTSALVTAAGKLDGEKRKAVREALAERLSRMNAETLRGLAKGEEAELRRGVVLAMAMKDDKAHIPDLIAALTDDEEIVVRAARAGLKSLTSEDFGPNTNATAGEKRLAAADWKRWLDKQKK